MAKKSSTEKEIENPNSGNKKDKSDSGKVSDTNKTEDLKKYFKDSFVELKKIQWPTRKQATAETIVVLITVIFLTSLVYIIDNGLSWIFSIIYEQ